MSNHSTSVGFRVRNFQPFTRLTTSADERQSTSDFGFVTYDDDGHYQVTSLRVGLRSDHVYDLLGPTSSMCDTATPLDEDRDLLLDADSKGLILTRRDGDGVQQLDADARKAESESIARDRDEMNRVHDADVRELAALRAERAQAVSM